MNNTKIAKQLIKIAKSLVAETSADYHYNIGPFNINTITTDLGWMGFSGKFYTVSAPFQNMTDVKQEIKKIGFKWSGEEKVWLIYWKKFDKAKLDKILQDYCDKFTTICPYMKNSLLQGDFIFDGFKEKYFQGKYHLLFHDDDNNKYHLITRKLVRMKSDLHPDKGIIDINWLQSQVGNKIHIIGSVFDVVETPSYFQVFASVI